MLIIPDMLFIQEGNGSFTNYVVIATSVFYPPTSFLSTLSVFIDSVRKKEKGKKTGLWLKGCQKNLGSFRQTPVRQWALELILDTQLGHFYHGLSSMRYLKARLEASIEGLLTGL